MGSICHIQVVITEYFIIFKEPYLTNTYEYLVVDILNENLNLEEDKSSKKEGDRSMEEVEKKDKKRHIISFRIL